MMATLSETTPMVDVAAEVGASSTEATATASSANGSNIKEQRPKMDLAQIEARKKELQTLYPKPDDQEYKQQKEKFAQEIAAVQKKIDANQKAIETFFEKKTNDSEEVVERKARIAALVEQLNKMTEERNRFADELKEAETRRDRLSEEVQNKKKNLQYFSSEEIERNVERLEERIQHETLDMAEEKRLVAQIAALKKSRPLIEDYHRTAEALNTAKEVARTLYPEVRSRKQKVYDIVQELKAEQAVLEASRAESRSSGPNIAELKRETNEARSKLKQLRDDRGKLIETYKKLHDEWFKAQGELNKLRDDEYKIRRAAEIEERRRADEEYRKKTAVEEKKALFLNEIEICQSLISYLEQLTLKSTSSAASAAEQKERKKALDTALAAGGYMKTKEDRKPQKKAAARPAAPAAAPAEETASASASKKDTARPLTFPMEKLTAFAKAGVAIPASTADIAQTLETLAQKKKDFESKRQAALDAVAKENPEATVAESPVSNSEPSSA